MWKRWMYYISLFIIILIIVIYWKFADKSPENTELQKELTIIEAIDIGHQEAIRWDSNAMLSYVTSVDDTEEGGLKGESGKRREWNLVFAKPNSNQHYLLQILDGVVKKSKNVTGPNKNNELINPSEILLDSPQLLTIAKNHYNLSPGIQWAKGYHYVLRKHESKIILQVVGLDEKNNMAKIFIDMNSGEVFDAIHRVAVGGGLISIDKNNNETKLLTEENYNYLGVNTKNKHILEWGYAGLEPEDNNFNLSFSNNSGLNWSQIDHEKGQILDAWFIDDSENFIVCTNKNIWFFQHHGRNKKDITPPIKEIRAITHLDDYIAIYSNDQIFFSENTGLSWEEVKIENSIEFLSIDSEGSIFVLSSDQSILKYKNNTWRKIKVPFENEKIMGLISGNDFLLSHSTDSLWAYYPASNKWKKVSFPEQVGKLIYKENEIFIISKIGTAYQLLKGGDLDWTLVKIFKPDQGKVFDITPSSNKFILATVPAYEWIDFKKE